jgi:pSer/pThr/pTyr-binding forkhead associated (FHA) protein
MAHLCLLTENGAVAQRWEIGERSVAVGRDKTADVTLPDDTLSRRHFLVRREGEGFLIKDLNSQNGTWVDGQRVRETPLRHQVSITAGRMRFLFSLPGPAPRDPTVGGPADLPT